MYYILDPRTGALKFISYQKIINICTTSDPEKRQALVNKCLDRALIRRFSDDIGYIKEFLNYYEKINRENEVRTANGEPIDISKGVIKPFILDFLEQLSLYTKMTFTDFIDIMGGAYVILKGDKGRIFRKFKAYHQYKYEINVPTLVYQPVTYNVLGYKLPLEYPYFKKKDMVPMSSHDRYMSNAFRMGAGELVLCDMEGMYKTSKAIKNPKFDILVGLSTVDKYKGDTAFQMESCRMDSGYNFLVHGAVFFEYLLVRKNVGAFKYSVHNDRNPLIIETCSGDVCPRFVKEHADINVKGLLNSLIF
uniref:Uncharacterized protein n=1 Tax=viral metagenome TaxID=1070528 RepID=A0A6C0KU96_9ZZZZ